MSIQIANAAGFWGDDPSAPQRLVRAARVNYLTLEYLAELTMSILAHLKSKDPRAGFATDILHVIDDPAPSLVEQPQLRIITNAGGINPEACAVAVARRLVDAELGDEGIAVVSGDDLTSRLAELQAAGCHLAHLDTGQPLADVPRRVACANAYLGAEPMVESLHRGARIVLTGRVADASLTVAPAVFEFGWEPRDWRRLAGATVAGHLIECGAQVTGGYSDRWDSLDLLDIGYPIAELGPEGDSVITKPAGSGGIVDRRSVVEQLVYEIGD
ncbi:MAG: acyclic terpene utilization AtuA family protein, partial [Pirellulaceae bacterium]